MSGLTEAAKRHRVPGAALAVFDGAALREEAAGVLNARTGVEATPDSVFEIGSITKLFTATLVLQLVEEGALALDLPLQRALPELELLDRDATARVTLRHLLSHTSGIDGDFFRSTGRGDDCLERYVLACSALPQLHEPGRLFSYCNAGFSLLGRIVEKARGRVFDDALRAHLLRPLGTEGMQTLPEEMLRYRVAVGHLADAATGEASVAPPWRGMRASAPAGAGVVAMARDLVRFARLHLDDGRAQDGSSLLSAESTRAMQVQQVALPGPEPIAGWGLGWMLFQAARGRVIGHDGGTAGQASFLRVVPERRVVVALLTNGGDAAGLAREVLSEELARHAGVSLAELPDPGPAADDARLLGSYERFAARLEIRRDGDALRLHQRWLHPPFRGLPDAPPLALEPLGPQALLARVPPFGTKSTLVFQEPDAQGRPGYVRLNGRLHRRSA